MKDIFSIVFLLLASLVSSAQEGFWSVDQLEAIQPKLIAAGLPFSAQQIRSAKYGGFAQAVIHLAQGGQATFVNDHNLAIGTLPTYLIPDTIWLRMQNGVWLAQNGGGIRLNDGYPEVFLQSVPTEKPVGPIFEANVGDYYKEYTLAADVPEKSWHTQMHQFLDNPTIIGVIRDTIHSGPENQVCVLLRMEKNPLQLIDFSDSLTAISRWCAEPSDGPQLILGYPNNSSIHRSSFELQYALALSKCHQDLDRALGTYLTRPPFITEEGVFRRYEDPQFLAAAVSKHTLWEAEFRHQLNNNPQLKTRYKPLLDSCGLAFKELQRYAPAQVYTKGIIYSPCSFFEAVRLFTMWRGRMGSSAHRLPTYQESEYFPEVFKRLPPTENELLLPELFQRYFTQLPADQLSPYAMRQAIYAQKDYSKLSETLLIQSKFGQPETVFQLLDEDFLQNIDLIATDPAVHLVDSMLQFYAEKVIPRIEKARHKAYVKEGELTKIISELVPDYPAYPDADNSLRLSYGTSLVPDLPGSGFWASNAHLLEGHIGSPVIDNRGQLIGIVKSIEAGSNAYFYDPAKSRALIWSVLDLRKRMASHPLGAALLREWP